MTKKNRKFEYGITNLKINVFTGIFWYCQKSHIFGIMGSAEPHGENMSYDQKKTITVFLKTV